MTIDLLTIRDFLYALGLVFMGTGVYIAIVQRVTRMEALAHRVERVEAEVSALQDKGSEESAQLARLAALLEGQGLRILSLEGAVQDGIARVLAAIAIQARPS